MGRAVVHPWHDLDPGPNPPAEVSSTRATASLERYGREFERGR